MKPSEGTESGLRQAARKIYRAALAEVDSGNLIRKYLKWKGRALAIQGKVFDLTRYKNIYFVAFGKAAPYMARALARRLGKRLREGVVLGPPHQEYCGTNIKCLPVSHPLPDQRNVAAAEKVLELATRAGEGDLIFILISGGGSAHLCLPAAGVSLEEKRCITESLLKAGADITELNTVRKHLSAIKGGRLAQAAFPAAVINLVISDVIGDDLSSIASGPTHWDSSTYADACQVLMKFKLWDGAPSSIKKIIRAGIKGNMLETLRKADPVFEHVFTFILGNNLMALQAAKKEAARLDFRPSVFASSDHGEATDAARKYISLLEKRCLCFRKGSRPICLLAGGELTVSVRGKGKGGRNQEFILAALAEILKKRGARPSSRKQTKPSFDWLMASLGTDGIDGPTDAAGAWIGPSILEKAKRLSLNPEKYLKENNSYHFFKKTGSLIRTGPTRTNVMDLRIFLLRKS